MPSTVTESGPAMSAVDFFKSKLEYESTPHALKRDMEAGDVIVLDVRDKDSYAKEHIAGAKNIPLSELMENRDNLPKGKPIVTYCWDITCAMATHAALELAGKGFKVKDLFGGIEAWKKKGFPVEGN